MAARLGHIPRQGSVHVRWAMVEAAHKALIGPGPLRSRSERIARRRDARSHRCRGMQPLYALFYGLREDEMNCLQVF